MGTSTGQLMRCNRPIRAWRHMHPVWRWGFGLYVWLLSMDSMAQQNGWRAHVSYNTGQDVAVVQEYVYAASENGFWVYHKPDNTWQLLGREQGFSDSRIGKLLYLPQWHRLVVGYRSGRLDVLSVSATGAPGSVTAISAIADAPSLPPGRAIRHLLYQDNRVLISTDFGIAWLNPATLDLTDTYFSRRADGTPIPVFQTAVAGDSLYALTAAVSPTDSATAIRAIRYNSSINVADPANWQSISTPAAAIETLLSLNGQLSATVNRKGIYVRQAGSWQLKEATDAPLVRQFRFSDSTAILATNRQITAPGMPPIGGALLTNPNAVVADGATLWIADAQSGLLRGQAGQLQAINPNGPSQQTYSGLYAYPYSVLALGSSHVEVFSISDNRWHLVDNPAITSTAAAYVPVSHRLYVAGNGLWQQTSPNEPFTRVTLPAGMETSISRLTADLAGNVWIIVQSPRAENLYVLRADNAIEPIGTLPVAGRVSAFTADHNGFLWLVSEIGTGLTVFDPATGRSRQLTTQANSGGLLTSSVRAIATDRNGVIWIGTDLGPMVFSDPARSLSGSVNAQPPVLNRRRLLANETVTAVAVDGGNNKWLATRTGLYYVSADGSQLLASFTPANSSFPADRITALAIEPTSGLVFAATPDGLFSYQGTATEPADALTAIQVFPNPVRPDFAGNVTIRGLTENATVKILDAGGQLVFETRSQGGSAEWNLTNYRGQTAQTGIYMVVVVSADGREGLAAKLAVIR